jgi:outer membrane receptor protein involved in Fe transport
MKYDVTVRSAELRASFLAGASVMSLLATPAWGQDVPNVPPEAVTGQAAQASAARPTSTAAQDQTIVVTGSRIPSPTLTSPSPIQVITAKAIENNGATNVQDVLQENPAVGRPGQSRTAGARDINPGLATVNLRNLGDNRTLVLIDGRRSVGGVPGTSAVDLSMIPTSFVERIDILTGGASAVYGSDAIAGVVNFIYKKHLQGLHLNAQAGMSKYHDDRNLTANATFGSDFADGRANIMMFAGWDKQGTVEGWDRARTRAGLGSLGNSERQGGNTDANLKAAQDLFTGFYSPSSVGPGGIFNFAGAGSRIIQPDGTFRPYNPAIDGFNSSFYQQIASPSKKITVASRINYDVTDKINVFAETTFVNFRTEGRREASPMRTDSALGAFSGSNGFYPIQFQVLDPNTGQTVILNNPLVPAPVFAAADNRFNQDAINSKDISFLLRTTMFPPGRRTTPTERDNFRIVLGTDTELPVKDWKLHAYYQYGFTKQRQSMTGLADLNRLAQALQVIPDVFDFNHNGNTTEPICVDANARSQGCVPINVYGLNPDGSTKISPEAVAWLQTQMDRDSKQTMQVAAADVAGSLFNLPYGPVQASVGVEYRKESSRDDFDPLTNEARNGYVQEPDISGSFNVKEAYGELVVPLLANLPFAQNLTFRTAARVSDYSTSGAVHAWNVGGEWSPVRDIRFRGVYAYAVRAPNINELFSPAASGVTTIVDPCQGVTLAQTSTVAQNCRADPSVLANIQSNGSFTLTFPDTQGVGIVSSSNVNLKPEVGKTLTFGAVINPRSIDALRDLTLTADYYDIKLAGAINQVSASTILNHCYAQGLAPFCSLIMRRAQPSGAFSIGSVQQINLSLVNSGGLFSRGLDFTLSYTPRFFGGRAGVSASWTHLLKNGIVPLTGDAFDNTMGEIGTPRDRANVTVSWDNRLFGFTVDNQFIGKQMLDYENYQTRFVLANGSLPPRSLFTVGSKIYTDAQVRYTGFKHFELFAGVNNLFNVEQPPLYGGLPIPDISSLYDAIGRRYYAGARARF